MQKTLIDSGPLIALFDRSDKYYTKVLQFIKNYSGELITTWSVITEVSHMLDFDIRVQIDFLRWCELGGVKICEITQEELGLICDMMKKYGDVPMDLADATLLYMANKTGVKNIISIDSDFDIYRTLKKQNLINLLT